MTKKTPKYKIFKTILIVILVVIFDQISKYSVIEYFTDHQVKPLMIAPILDITLVWNYGVSFGFLNEATQTQTTLIIFSLSIVLILLFWIMKTRESKAIIPLAMVIGGALGNIIDRLTYGAVVDFIDFHYLHYHYPAFNVADSCIVIGALLLIKQSLVTQDEGNGNSK